MKKKNGEYFKLPDPVKKNTKLITASSKVTKNPSEHSRAETKSSPWIEDYLDCFTFKMKPVTEAFIERISQELITWAQDNPDAIKLSQFYTAKRIPRDTFRAWIRFDKFKHARELALEIIGARRELGTLKKEYDASTNNVVMHLYDQDWKDLQDLKNAREEEIIRLRAELSKDSDNPKNGTYNIYMDSFKWPQESADDKVTVEDK